LPRTITIESNADAAQLSKALKVVSLVDAFTAGDSALKDATR
jgi:hypothetical protein